MDIQTKDGILLRNIPDGTPEDAIKSRIAQIRAEMPQQPATTAQEPDQADTSVVPQWGRENPNLYGVAGAVRETLGPLAELGGMAGGAIAGTAAAGPVGGVGGAALGYGAGKELTQMADVALGNRQQEELPQALGTASKNVAEGAALEMSGQALAPAAKALWGALKTGTSTLVGDVGTGVGSQTLRRLSQAGEAGGERAKSGLRNLRGKEPMEAVVEDAKSALRAMNEQRTQSYVANMQKIEGADKQLNFTLVDDAYNDLVKGFQHKGAWKIGADTQKKIQEIGETVNEWRKSPELHTTMGFDALKQRINDLMPGKLDAGKSGYAVTKMYNAIKNTIVKESPEYAVAMKDFEKSLVMTKEIERELSLGKRAAVGSALRKLQSITRDNANTSYGNRAAMAKALEEGGGANILDRVAGQAASSIAPRGLNKIMAQGTALGGAAAAGAGSGLAPLAIPMIAAQSPRLMGEAAVKFGQSAAAVKWASKKMGLSTDMVKQLIQGTYVGADNAERQQQLSQIIQGAK